MAIGVTAICKKCGKPSSVDSFVLDPVYKLVVCPDCVKERKMKENVDRQLLKEAKEKSKQVEELRGKPAGWDKEDEYLERRHSEKEKMEAALEKAGGNKIVYQCPKCNHKFAYDKEKRYPGLCPFCGTAVSFDKFGGF